jgi:hypothetical protein
MADTIKKDAKRSFSNTVSAGLKSLGGRGKTFYVLEFKNNSQMHKAKTTKEIIVDYIELGRSPKCQIRFGEDCRTVSGVHCAIMREGEHYFVKHLSKSNPTLINGKPVADKYYINSGDELTLSYGGPIIGFIVPQNNLTSSIPLTRRLSLFREQAMRPYKRAIALLSLLMVLMCTGFVYYTINTSHKISLIDEKYQQAKTQLEKDKETLNKLKEAGKISDEKYNSEIKRLQVADKEINKRFSVPNISTLYPSIYYIEVVQVMADLKGDGVMQIIDSVGWSGTGFLLNDGKFVTARHVIEGWNYPTTPNDYWLNEIATSGRKVVAKFKASSSSNDEFYFTSEQFYFNKTDDKKEVRVDSENNSHEITKPGFFSDWACGKYKKSGVLNYDSKLSLSLPAGTQLFTLGFPMGIGKEDRDKMEPQYSAFNVSSSASNGFINISSDGTDHGNSGGPVFAKTNNGFTVVGIVSWSIHSNGFVVPISRIINQ